MLSLCPWFIKNKALRICTIVAFMVLLMESEIWGETATIEEARQVSQNWLRYLVLQRGNWAGEVTPQLMEGQEIVEDDRLLGYYFPVSPSGYIAVPILKELPPVKAYSEKYRLDLNATKGFPALLKEVLLDRIRLYAKTYGSLDAVQPATGGVLLGREHKLEWARFLKSGKEFQADLAQGKFQILTEVGPLLTTSWHQNAPYNNLCPMGDGGRCVVGCVATAAAQIMKYWDWPTRGKDSHSYLWRGDNSCDGPVGGGTLSATFSDAYDWEGMQQGEQDALAELCYEVGVAFQMGYGRCASGAYTPRALTIFPTYFRYKDSIDIESRDDYDTAGDWFSIIQTEINNDRPMLYSIRTSTTGHAIVCDGWRDTGGQKQYHINYGWGGSHTDWFAIDQIYDTNDPMREYLYRYIQPAYRTLICGAIWDGYGYVGPLASDDGYGVTCDVVVPADKSLTIQSGVEIHFDSGFKMVAYGTLTASGNSTHPIYLVSGSDPYHGMKLMGDLVLKNGGEIKLGQ